MLLAICCLFVWVDERTLLAGGTASGNDALLEDLGLALKLLTVALGVGAAIRGQSVHDALDRALRIASTLIVLRTKSLTSLEAAVDVTHHHRHGHSQNELSSELHLEDWLSWFELGLLLATVIVSGALENDCRFHISLVIDK